MIRGEFFDYDSLTGLTEYYEETPDGKIHIHTYQDVEPVIDYWKALANEGLPDGNFKGEGWHYATIPAIVVGQLFKKGISVLDPNDTAKVVDEVNENYPWLKTTQRHHAVRPR
jgi:hypothetical protein